MIRNIILAAAGLSQSAVQLFSTPGKFPFTVPSGVTSISALAVGAGGRGDNTGSGRCSHSGGGGAIAYRNEIAVTPGQILYVEVGAGTSAEVSVSSQSGLGSTSSYSNLLWAAPGAKATTSTPGAGGLDDDSGPAEATLYSGGDGASGTAWVPVTGGAAATPAGNGASGATGTSLNGGGSGGGAIYSPSGWEAVANHTAYAGGYDGESGAQAGSGGGGAYLDTNLPGDGANGLVILLWEGRTFSAETIF